MGTYMREGDIFIKNHCGGDFLSKILFFSGIDLNMSTMWMLNTWNQCSGTARKRLTLCTGFGATELIVILAAATVPGLGSVTGVGTFTRDG